jgi:guanine deaminase
MDVLRGPIVWPLGPDRAVRLADGVVDPALPAPRPAAAGDPEPVDGLIVPAFADWHFHWVQLGIAGADRTDLLRWLVRTTWPAERRFADAATARAEAPGAVERLRSCGTLAGAAWGSPHAVSAEAFLAAAPASFLCGPAVMTRNGPPELLASTDGLADLLRAHPSRAVVAPRFALSCDEGTLAALGALAAESGVWIQTHLSENADEVAEVGRLFPAARDYLEVYERAGLVGPRTLLAHAVHVSDDELARIAAARAVVVHCPTSNTALASGRMPLARLRAAGVAWVLGSDVGAGPDPCLLDVIAEALDVHPTGAVSAVELFHRATLGLRALEEGLTDSSSRGRRRPTAGATAPRRSCGSCWRSGAPPARSGPPPRWRSTRFHRHA